MRRLLPAPFRLPWREAEAVAPASAHVVSSFAGVTTPFAVDVVAATAVITAATASHGGDHILAAAAHGPVGVASTAAVGAAPTVAIITTAAARIGVFILPVARKNAVLTTASITAAAFSTTTAAAATASVLDG